MKNYALVFTSGFHEWLTEHGKTFPYVINFTSLVSILQASRGYADVQYWEGKQVDGFFTAVAPVGDSLRYRPKSLAATLRKMFKKAD
jgi:hypothetical protein